jgi:ribosomal protein S18 acetylase RimI-like enzyme
VRIAIVKASQVRPLRNLVLRPGLPIETTYYKEDNDIDTIHLAYIINKEIISIGTFYPQNDSILKSKNGYRLRGIATHPEFRRNSAATKLMKESFTVLKHKNCDIIWCNARLIALDFYKSLGFKINGKEFNIKDIGSHFLMWKSLV